MTGGDVTGEAPGPSRDLIGKRNIYRYSPAHLYEHVYMSSERYMWQCLQGVQRGHGDVDLSTVWKFDDGLYLFCFREFKIAVASVWLHDLGYALRTTGIFLGPERLRRIRALARRRSHLPARLRRLPRRPTDLTEETTMPSNKEIIEAHYAGFVAGDLEAVMAPLRRDIVWTEAEGFPSRRHLRRPAGGRRERVRRARQRDWDGYTLEVDEVLQDGDDRRRASAPTRAPTRRPAAPFSARVVHLWRFVDGKAVKFEQVTDTAMVNAAID